MIVIVLSTLLTPMIQISQTLVINHPPRHQKFFSIGHHNLIRIFISSFYYLIHDNDPIDDDLVKVNNDDFNEFRIIGYDGFKIFLVL